MARLSTCALSALKQKILEDLYGKSEEDLKKRKMQIAKENRYHIMEPLKEQISKLPSNLFNKSPNYQLFINYNAKDPCKHKRLIEIWEYDCGINAINPIYIQIYKHSYETPCEGNLVPVLVDKAMQLCEDIIKSKNEKQQLIEYLDTTMKKYTGTIQLRKVWPISLHRYLPIEVKQTRSTKKSKVKDTSGIKISVPDFIEQRLTANLLEK